MLQAPWERGRVEKAMCCALAALGLSFRFGGFLRWEHSYGVTPRPGFGDSGTFMEVYLFHWSPVLDMHGVGLEKLIQRAVAHGEVEQEKMIPTYECWMGQTKAPLVW